MYIVVIGWLYVVVMIAAVSDSLLKAVVRFLLLGALPLAIVLSIRQLKARSLKARQHAAAAEAVAPAVPASTQSASRDHRAQS